MADCYKKIIMSAGDDPDREGLVETPMRAAKAFSFFTKVRSIDRVENTLGYRFRQSTQY